MKKSRKYGFVQGNIYPALITNIKNDCIFFTMKERSSGEKIKAAYFIKGERINPHQIFKKGEEIPIRLIRHCNPKENSCGIAMLVCPEELPVDIYINKFPIGSIVNGRIQKLDGSTMTLELVPNVTCITKRCRNAQTGKYTDCRIEKYNPNKKSISVRIIQ